MKIVQSAKPKYLRIGDVRPGDTFRLREQGTVLMRIRDPHNNLAAVNLLTGEGHSFKALNEIDLILVQGEFHEETAC
jgi:hypothetical protein